MGWYWLLMTILSDEEKIAIQKQILKNMSPYFMELLIRNMNSATRYVEYRHFFHNLRDCISEHQYLQYCKWIKYLIPVAAEYEKLVSLIKP